MFKVLGIQQRTTETMAKLPQNLHSNWGERQQAEKKPKYYNKKRGNVMEQLGQGSSIDRIPINQHLIREEPLGYHTHTPF